MRFLRHAFACALSLVAASAVANAATYTSNVTVPVGSYVDLGAGPLEITMMSLDSSIELAFADASTAIPANLLGTPYGPLTGTARKLTICQTQHVYAQSLQASAVLVSVSPATCVSAGGGGGGVVTQGTPPWAFNQTQVAGVALGAASAWGAAPSGNVQGVNANVLAFPGMTAPGVSAALSLTIQGNTSGIAVPVSAADGALATIGSKADAANAATGNTLMAVERAIAASAATIAGAVNTPLPPQTTHGVRVGAVEGETASGAAVTENPLLDGARAATAEPTAVADGQKVALMATKSGKAVVKPYAISELDWRGSITATTTSAATFPNSISSTLKTYVTGIQCGRNDSGTSGTAIQPITLTLNDTAASFVIIPALGGGGGNNMTFPTPLVLAAVNTALTFTSDTAITTIKCSAQGYFAP